MAGASLNQSATLMCPHGGTVSIVTANAQVKGGGGYLVTQSDTFVVAGCPFVVGVVASPCVKVQWVSPDTAVTVGGAPTLSQGSVGLCLNAAQAPQGPVVVAATQAQVQSR
jgi:hypothetical protein